MAEGSPGNISAPTSTPDDTVSHATPHTASESFTHASSSTASSVMPSALLSLTSKKWVVPPRPKPGRKPALDAPPSKRKAQNRAAQRAFRERRAARVGELEEEMKKLEEEDRKEQDALKGHIDQLQGEVEELRMNLDRWMQRCQWLEAEVSRERSTRQEILSPGRAPLPTTSVASPAPANTPHQSESQQGGEPLGCGKCSSINDCACLQAVIDMPNLDAIPETADPSSSKRAHSPAQEALNSKRVKPQMPTELETDFTSSFRNQRQHNNIGVQQNPSPCSPSAVADPCGFCADGTACICAEMEVAEGAKMGNQSGSQSGSQPSSRQKLGHILLPDPRLSVSGLTSSTPNTSNLSQVTPPPSDTDGPNSASSAQQRVRLPSMIKTPRSPCANGPGTCQQCRSDPNSTLFCKSLAACRQQRLQRQQQQQQQQATDCGGKGGSINRYSQLKATPLRSASTRKNDSHPAKPNRETEPSPSIPQDQASEAQPITLSCADAYTTLSRHPGYSRAMGKGQMGVWMRRLLTTPNHSAVDSTMNVDSSTLEPPSRRAEDGRTGRRVRGQPDNDDGDSNGNGDGNGSRNGGGSGSGCPNVDDGSDDRPAMLDIDAAEVMAVLSEFDRRFV